MLSGLNIIFTVQNLKMRLVILLLFLSMTVVAQQKKIKEIEIVNAKKMNEQFMIKIIKTKVGDLLNTITSESD